MSTSTQSLVRLHHVPGWLRLRIFRAFGTPGGNLAGVEALYHAVAESEKWVQGIREASGEPKLFVPHWLDHWGSTTIDGEVRFLSEPYLDWPPNRQDLAVPEHLAESTNCRLIVLPHSEWNPPRTIRLLFKPNPLGGIDAMIHKYQGLPETL